MKLSVTREVELSTNGKVLLLEYLLGNYPDTSDTSSKVAIIKALRESEGWGLKETKDFIDAAEFHTAKNLSGRSYINTPPGETRPPVSLGELLRRKLP